MKYSFLLFILAGTINVIAQISISDDSSNSTATNPNVLLDLQTESKGLLIPRLTANAMETLKTTAAEGLIIFNADDKCYYGFQQNDWFNLDGNCLPPAEPTVFEEGSFIFTGIQSYQNPAAPGGSVQADRFSILTFGTIPAGTIFYFTDLGWKNPENEFRSGEGVFRWTVGAQPIPAKTEVVFYSPQNLNSGTFEWTITSPPASVLEVGTIENVNNSGSGKSIQLTNNGDNIFVFNATDDSNPLNSIDKFLVAIKMEGDWDSTSSSTNTTAIPPGLVNGSTAIAIENTINNQKIQCSEIMPGMTDDAIRAVANDYNNWSGTDNDPLALPTGCSY